jgi:FtsP/CotA-like multicopper oxidase with cupredoxin domain
MRPIILLAAITFVSAIPLFQNEKRAACSGNTADDRSTWCDYSIDTDYATEVPDTGVTREYWLELTDVTIAPDGYSRSAVAINGSIPGPTIFADWGDTVVVHVTNGLTTSQNGTSIHFHGIRQNYTVQNDGVVSLTQCPTAPGDSITYTWRATQYGSSWYHSHIGLQAWEGVAGGIVINGPASADYDTDLGVLFLSDWSHRTADQLYSRAQTSGPPTLDNGLINGTNVYGDDDSDSQTGTRFSTAFTAGTSYRLRLVNGAIDTTFKFSIDNHTLTVISTDFVPIEPYSTTMVTISMGMFVLTRVEISVSNTLQAKDMM